jgi:hypothetical protein
MAFPKRRTHTFLSNVAAGTTPVPTPLSTEGYEVVAFQVVGLSTGTVQWEATLAMEPTTTTWIAVRATDANTGTAATTAAADGISTLDVRGFSAVRARATTVSIVNNGRLDVYGLAQAGVS